MGRTRVARLEEEERNLRKPQPEQKREWPLKPWKAAAATVAASTSSWSCSSESLSDVQQLARLEHRPGSISLVHLNGLSVRHVRQYLSLLSTRSLPVAG